VIPTQVPTPPAWQCQASAGKWGLNLAAAFLRHRSGQAWGGGTTAAAERGGVSAARCRAGVGWDVSVQALVLPLLPSSHRITESQNGEVINEVRGGKTEVENKLGNLLQLKEA